MKIQKAKLLYIKEHEGSRKYKDMFHLITKKVMQSKLIKQLKWKYNLGLNGEE